MKRRKLFGINIIPDPSCEDGKFYMVDPSYTSSLKVDGNKIISTRRHKILGVFDLPKKERKRKRNP